MPAMVPWGFSFAQLNSFLEYKYDHIYNKLEVNMFDSDPGNEIIVINKREEH